MKKLVRNTIDRLFPTTSQREAALEARLRETEEELAEVKGRLKWYREGIRAVIARAAKQKQELA